MAGAIFTANGTTISIGPVQAAEPANAAAYGALAWSAIGYVESLGDFGDESSAVNFSVIGDGRVRKAKGARDAGTLPLVTAYIADDVGQLALIAGEATTGTYPFKVVLPNKITAGGTGEIKYFLALVQGKRLSVGGNDNIARLNFGLNITTKLTEVAAT